MQREQLRSRIVWIMATTDRGSNEVWARKAIHVSLQALPNCFFLPSDCYEHQVHLGVLGGLRLCDDMLKGQRTWKYFSSVAIVSTTLRDLSQSLFLAWTNLFGHESAIKSVKALFPRCIGGRWGSVHESEARFLKANLQNLSVAVRTLFEARPHLLENDKAPNSSSAVDDDVAMEESTDFAIRMGKWRRRTWTVLNDHLFAKLVGIMHATREPWMHLSHFLKKKLPSKSPRHMHLLVCGKARDIFDEFATMIFSHLGSFISHFDFQPKCLYICKLCTLTAVSHY